jgi:precorrin-6B methylase 2
MLPVLALDIQRGQRVLDVCAAPWSKTTQIASIQWNIGSIVALEKQKIRYDVLAHNISLQGATNIECIHTDALKWLKSTDQNFDRARVRGGFTSIAPIPTRGGASIMWIISQASRVSSCKQLHRDCPPDEPSCIPPARSIA